MIAKEHTDHGREDFSIVRLLEGGSSQRYSPLHQDAWPAYEAWLAKRGG